MVQKPNYELLSDKSKLYSQCFSLKALCIRLRNAAAAGNFQCVRGALSLIHVIAVLHVTKAGYLSNLQ